MQHSAPRDPASGEPQTEAAFVPYSAFVSAQTIVSGLVHKTPLLSSSTLSKRVGRPVFFKCENLQRTGSFKVRGALVSIARLPSDQADRGVVTVSAGNHAQAVAWAASARGIRSTVVMPEHASPTKVKATKEYGARVLLHGTAADAFVEARRLAASEGLTFLHPFDHPSVIAGQGTVALEVLDQLLCIQAGAGHAPGGDLSIVVPVGGGGQISGIAGAIGSLQREGPPSGQTDLANRTRVYGAEPTGAPGMYRSLATGRAVTLDAVNTVADGLAAPMAGELNYYHVARYVEEVLLVEDDMILEAMSWCLFRAKLLLEPAGAAGVAALLQGLLPDGSGPVIVVLTGGNVDSEIVKRALNEHG